MDDPFRFDRTGVLQEPTYSTFGCKVFKEDPETPDKLRPDVTFHREFREGELTAPDGRRIKFWSLVDGGNAAYPSPTIRVRTGQIVHTHLKARKGPHTIHHHGINPTTFNDGVGHVSFEAGEYTYQWKAANPGTNFYHCHRNTVLHFEMGMFGLLIVDPPEGPGFLLNGERYQVEKFWVADDMDPRWHEFSHDAGLCGQDVGLNRFEPKYFFLTGVFNNRTMTDSRTVVNARVGQTILIRLLNASYSVLRTKLDIDAVLIGIDGHSIRNEPWERSVTIPAGQWFELVTAQRYALVIRPTRAGVFGATMEFRHWITRQIQDNGRGVINTKIVVT
jgi:FtsP/CotA-like multicopper oxidase with cupredoxin domain